MKILAGLLVAFALAGQFTSGQPSPCGEHNPRAPIHCGITPEWQPISANTANWPDDTVQAPDTKPATTENIPVATAAPVAVAASTYSSVAVPVYFTGTHRTPVRRLLSAPFRWRRARCGIPAACGPAAACVVRQSYHPGYAYPTTGGWLVPSSVSDCCADVSALLDGRKRVQVQFYDAPVMDCQGGVCRIRR